MTSRQIAILCLLTACYAASATAFETPTHYLLTESAAKIALTDNLLLNIGRLPANFKQTLTTSPENDSRRDFGDVNPRCEHSQPFLIYALVACGAMFEDFYFLDRPLNHFLDPQHLDSNGLGSPLLDTQIFVEGSSPPVETPPSGQELPPGLAQGYVSAAEWGLKDHPDAWMVDLQRYSYKDADEYWWQALTYRDGADRAADRDTRERNWGLLFQTLGQVVHLVQDMASPQHTRGEYHFDKFDLGNVTQKSRYEQRALDAKVAAWIDSCLINQPSGGGCTYNPPAPITPVYPAFAAHFQTPRAFWESSDKTGLAQVTSFSFPSNLRNFRADQPGHYVAAPGYPLPAPSGVTDVPIAQLAGQLDSLPSFFTEKCGSDVSGCRMRMIGAAIQDPLGQGSLYNDRAASESIFDQDLTGYHALAVVYDPYAGKPTGYTAAAMPTINRFNIDRAYSLLIPRAVSYSAGLLNFFFRGSIGIKPPPGGAYAIVDDSPFSSKSPTDVDNGYRGFNSIRVMLANTTPTPEGSPEQLMTDGKLWAVLRFQRNDCYTDDFDGMNTKSDVPLSDCLDDIEEVVVSDPIDRTGADRTVLRRATDDEPDGEQIAFTFKDGLPINAWNVLLQIVFRGKLGAESNKLAVSTVDLAEPSFFTAYNNTDYVVMGNQCYRPQQIASDPALWKRVNTTCQNPLHAEDVMSDACYMSKFGFHLDDANDTPPRFTIGDEISEAGDGRIPPGHFGRVAFLSDPDEGIDLALQFRNPGLHVDPKDKLIHVEPFHAHMSRETPGEETDDSFASNRGVNAWYGFSYMVDVEAGTIADADVDCILGAHGELSGLVGDARYPVPSTITFAP